MLAQVAVSAHAGHVRSVRSRTAVWLSATSADRHPVQWVVPDSAPDTACTNAPMIWSVLVSSSTCPSTGLTAELSESAGMDAPKPNTLSWTYFYLPAAARPALSWLRLIVTGSSSFTPSVNTITWLGRPGT